MHFGQKFLVQLESRRLESIWCRGIPHLRLGAWPCPACLAAAAAAAGVPAAAASGVTPAQGVPV